jgi:hypothetical protein
MPIIYNSYIIGPTPLHTKAIYAYSMAAAFDIARSTFGSSTLHCFGTVN